MAGLGVILNDTKGREYKVGRKTHDRILVESTQEIGSETIIFHILIFSKSRFSKVEVLNLRVSGWGTFEGFGEGKEESGIDRFKIKYILKCQIQNTENHVIIDVL